MFNFKRLVKKYSKTPLYHLKETEGYYDYEQGGEWIEGDIEEIEFIGALVYQTNEELQYDEGGTYSTKDKKLYTYNDFDKGDKIKANDKEYTIQEKKDYADYDEGLYIYYCRKVGD